MCYLLWHEIDSVSILNIFNVMPHQQQLEWVSWGGLKQALSRQWYFYMHMYSEASHSYTDQWNHYNEIIFGHLSLISVEAKCISTNLMELFLDPLETIFHTQTLNEVYVQQLWINNALLKVYHFYYDQINKVFIIQPLTNSTEEYYYTSHVIEKLHYFFRVN